MKRRWIVFGATAVLALALVATFFLYKHMRESTKEIRRFETEFGILLPADSEIIFSKNLSGWFGDGEILYVYQLNDSSIATLIEQSQHYGWSSLPFDMKQVMIFKEMIGISDEEIGKYMPYGLPKGMGIIVDRRRNHEGQLMTTNDFMAYTNFTIGLIDPRTNRVYCYLYNS